MSYSSKAQGKRPAGASRRADAAQSARKKLAGDRKTGGTADVAALMEHNDFLVPRIAEAVAKTERFALIATWRAVSREFYEELQQYVKKLVASFNSDLKLRANCMVFERKWTHWLKMLPRNTYGDLSVNDETPPAEKDFTQRHLALAPPYGELALGGAPTVSGLPSDVPLEVVPRMVARCLETIMDTEERLAHSVGKAQASSLSKFMSNVGQLSTVVVDPSSVDTTSCFEFGSYTLFAMAASTCELCCVGGKARFCRGVNAGHGGCSFELLPKTRQVVYSRSACLCAHMAMTNRWKVPFGTEKQMRCDLERGIVVADSDRARYFMQDQGSRSVDAAQMKRQLEQRALLRAMLRVAYAPTKEVKLDPHELRRLVGGTGPYISVFGSDDTHASNTRRYIWLKNHPCIPQNFSLQSRLELTDAQMDSAVASVARQTEEIRLSTKALVSNELERYQKDFLDILHLDSLMRDHTFDSVEAELPGTTSLFKFLVRGNIAHEHVSSIPGIAHLATTVTTMLTVGVRYDSAYSGLRASPWAYSYVCGVSAGWIVPEATKDSDPGNMLRLALDVCNTTARWQQTKTADDQQRVLREWETRVLAMHAFDALEWDSIVVEPNEDDEDDERTVATDVIRTHFCSWSIAGVNVRTLHSNLHKPTAIRAAAVKLLNRAGYASDKLPSVDKPYPVFLEGVARLLAFAPDTRAAALCLLSTTPLCTALYTEDLVDAGLRTETLAPVADYMRNAAASQ